MADIIPIPINPRFIDVSGRRFGKLVVNSYAGILDDGRHSWFCACDCGRSLRVRHHALLRGTSRSCGIGICESARKHGMSQSPEHRIWSHLKGRCLKPKNNRYPSYGGRGIRVCDRWLNSFECFLDDMGKRPSTKHSIDRIDNNGDYEPNNCRWVTLKQNARNTRANRFLTIGGVTRTVVEWAEISGMKAPTIYRRLYVGIEPKVAVFAPAGHKSADRRYR